MKILICSANYAPEPTGIGKYSGEMAEWLASKGHDVCVVAAPPYYPSWKVADDYAGRHFAREQRNGVRVFRAPLWVPTGPGGLKRVLHLLSFAVTSWPWMLWLAATWRPNVVMVVSPFLTCAPAGLLAAAVSGAPSWLHVQDFEVDVAFQMGLLRGKRLQSLVLAMERCLFRCFKRVSSISTRMLDRASRKGVAAERLVYFRNWVDVDAIKPLGQVSRYRSLLRIEKGALVVLYSGTLGVKQGLQVIPAVARAMLTTPRMQFVICGDGPMKAELESLSAGVSNLTFLPLQPSIDVAELLNLADIHLLPQDAAAEDLVLPSKLGGMLASGRPVIATCSAGSEVAEAVVGRGLVVPPGDVDALVAAIARLAGDAALRMCSGQAARDYAVLHLGRDAVLGRLEREMALVAGLSTGRS